MTADPFKRVRAHLAGARQSLTASKPRTNALIERITTVERQLDPAGQDWHGDPHAAGDELGRIVAALAPLTRVPPGRATGVDPLRQDGKPVPLPGVAGAIDRLNDAIDLLKAMP
jgi:hypothetical protein